MRKNSGITLITLVITIIVMLILAGISINMTIGNGGIFNTTQKAIDTTSRRRVIQDEYNKEHGIIPKTIIKDITNTLEITKSVEINDNSSKKEITKEIEKIKALMSAASKALDFERAIELREQLSTLRKMLKEEK